MVATASNDPEATKLLSTQEFDEYGNPKGELTPKFGWLGGKARRTELSSGVIQMGVRSYVPAMGRFLSPDPLPGGSANAYECAAGDPINSSDLTGEKCSGSKRQIHRCEKKKERHRKKRRRREARRAARRANGEKVIWTSFRTKSAAERFRRYLEGSGQFLERMQERLHRICLHANQVNKWEAEDILEMRRRATTGGEGKSHGRSGLG